MCSHLGLIARQYFLFAYICHYFSLIISSSQDIRPPTVWPSGMKDYITSSPFHLFSSLFVSVAVGNWSQGVAEATKRPAGGTFLFPFLGFQGSNSSHKPWWQAPLPVDPPCFPPRVFSLYAQRSAIPLHVAPYTCWLRVTFKKLADLRTRPFPKNFVKRQ